MNNIQNRRNENNNKPVPGCLGRVVNFFDLSTPVTGNRLLTDKQHFDGFGHSRRQSDAMRISPIGDEVDDEVVACELTKNSSTRNIKMLIDEEMSKEEELPHTSPNLVAKLMGLETLPQTNPNSVINKTHSRSYSASNIATGLDSWRQEKRSLEHNRYKEFPDMTRQPQKERYMREKLPEKDRYAETKNEKRKMDLVRQKFVEAKSLSTNEKQRQSKRYQDALEVLSSNRGLFLRLLEESNSFSQNLHEHRNSPPSNTKRITVLRPSKMLDDNQIPRPRKIYSKPSKKVLDVGKVNRLDKKTQENPTPPTRIVVLKPSNKPCNFRAAVSQSPSSPRENGEVMYRGPLDDDIMSRKETLMSSIFSNGYSGDESSFHKSENDYNLSDSEVVTPISRHTWDYIRKYENPYASSSFSHASCSPESSVGKEAKKRLSERWVLMGSNGNYQEKSDLRRSASTLAEMLALPDTKKGIDEVQETRESPICSTSNLNIEQCANDSPRNLLRSNSVPVSSTVLDPKYIAKTITPKSSFKEKISSLFFSRSKRTSKETSSSSQSKHESDKADTKLIEIVREETSKCSVVMDEEPLRNLQGLPSNSIVEDQIEKKPGVISPEANLCVTNPSAPRYQGENQDQPSPVSVLEPPFEEDYNFTMDSSHITSDKYGSKRVVHSVNSILIDKSPPIESITRTLSWDDSCIDTTTSYVKSSRVSRGSVEEEQEFFFFIKSLLSAAGFDGEVARNSFFNRWHSPESPLDPSLRDNLIENYDKDITNGPKQRLMRSNRKLAFDCVNTSLVKITGYDSVKKYSLSLLVDDVWECVKEWLPCEIPEEFLGDDVDSDSLVVEAMVNKEVVGNAWMEHMKVERENFGTDIQAVLLDELVQELVVDVSSQI